MDGEFFLRMGRKDFAELFPDNLAVRLHLYQLNQDANNKGEQLSVYLDRFPLLQGDLADEFVCSVAYALFMCLVHWFADGQSNMLTLIQKNLALV